MSESNALAAVRPKEPGSIAMVRTLGGIALISGALLALVYQATFNIIKQNKEKAVQEAVFTVIPGAQKQVAFELESGELKRIEGDPTGLPLVFAGFDGNGQFLGVALDAGGQGYGDVIRVLYGYAPDKQQIIGLKVLESKETPGLGDKIGKTPFLDNFAAMDVSLDDVKAALGHPIELVKHGTKTQSWQIDGISGATISSKAIAKMLQESTEKMLPVINKQLDKLKEAK